MNESILSVGIDLGTTTTQLVVSRLYVENTASSFSIPHMQICRRDVLYESEPHLTPLIDAATLDALAIEKIVCTEYRKAGIVPADVQTGAVIITGETARKENAKAVLEALSKLAGSFVVATAGPALEGVLAARGAGADQYAKRETVYVLNLDIGGGTTNLALYGPEGDLIDTGCLNVGGRLLKFDAEGTVTYISPVVRELISGTKQSPQNLQPLLNSLVQALEEAAGLRPRSPCMERFVTDKPIRLPGAPVVISFSGGVADLIREEENNWLRYGDLGPLLGSAIRRSKLCGGRFVFGKNTLRATVVGAGNYATELSGSTVLCSGAEFPLHTLPAVRLTSEEEQAPSDEIGRIVREKAQLYDPQPVVLSMKGIQSPPYREVLRLAEGIAKGMDRTPVVVAVECDMAKVLGQALRSFLGSNTPIVCLDGIYVPEGSFLDIAAPVAGGTAVPVVVKTLAFS